MCTTNFFKETVFLIGFILNIIISVILISSIILCRIQFKYVNINWIKTYTFHNLSSYELIYCLIYVFVCILGFFVFINKLECKIMQKIYIIYGILAFIYSIIICSICFISNPNIIKDNDESCKSVKYKGILKDFNISEKIFYEVNKILCSDSCPCPEGKKMNFQKCSYEEGLSNFIDKEYDSFDENNFISYWSNIEKKFHCVGLCKTFSFSSENEGDNINKFLFSDSNEKDIKYGCIYPLSSWMSKMIISFNCLVIINLILLVFCLYMAFALLFDKVYKGAILPK